MTGRRQGFAAGVRAGIGPAAATLPLGMTFGAFAVSAGWGAWVPLVGSVFAYSGSAQFAAVSVLASGGGAVVAVAAAALMNARMIPMGVAVTPSLSGGRLRRAVQSLAIVDASWVIAYRGGGRFDRYRLFGAAALQWPAWVGGTALGVVVAPAAATVETFGLDVVFPAFFLVLLLDELSAHGTRAGLVSALAGGATSGLLVLVAPSGVALIGATAAAVVVGLTRLGRSADPSRAAAGEQVAGEAQSGLRPDAQKESR